MIALVGLDPIGRKIPLIYGNYFPTLIGDGNAQKLLNRFESDDFIRQYVCSEYMLQSEMNRYQDKFLNIESEQYNFVGQNKDEAPFFF